jgi:hypothetical protein
MNRIALIFLGLLLTASLFVSCDIKGFSKGEDPATYTMGFEPGENISGLLSYNSDGGYNTQYGTNTEWIVKNDFRAHAGSRTIGSIYNDGGTANDDWLVLPAMTLSGTSKLTFYAAPQYIDKSEEKFSVLVSSSGNTPECFTTEILSHQFPKDTDSWTEFTLDLAAYGGQTVNIAFHCTSADQYCLRLDDISVTDLK